MRTTEAFGENGGIGGKGNRAARTQIFHFSVCQFPFFILRGVVILGPNDKCELTNDKWKIWLALSSSPISLFPFHPFSFTTPLFVPSPRAVVLPVPSVRE